MKNDSVNNPKHIADFSLFHPIVYCFLSKLGRDAILGASSRLIYTPSHVCVLNGAYHCYFQSR
jgi:hypothetical protein